jgi:hypothetical protein
MTRERRIEYMQKRKRGNPVGIPNKLRPGRAKNRVQFSEGQEVFLTHFLLFDQGDLINLLTTKNGLLRERRLRRQLDIYGQIQTDSKVIT